MAGRIRYTIDLPDDGRDISTAILDVIEPGAGRHTLAMYGHGNTQILRHSRLDTQIIREVIES